MSNFILESFKKLLATPDLASKKWIYEQYDSQVMNDTIAINGDAAIVRVRGTNKALAITSDCTPRYVKANPEIGAMQAVAETYRNISATGAKPLAITNCLNFGNPEKPQIMGQIVRAIQGINKASTFLNYPVVSGNVSLYNETDGKAINPTPTIGGVGLLKDLNLRASSKFKEIDYNIFVIGETKGHLDCSIYQRDILNIDNLQNPPEVDLANELKNSQFIRDAIGQGLIKVCHDISDGGLLVALFEMSNYDIGFKIDIKTINPNNNFSDEQIYFSEDQSRYIVAIKESDTRKLVDLAQKNKIAHYLIGKTQSKFINFNDISILVADLIDINNQTFEQKFSNFA